MTRLLTLLLLASAFCKLLASNDAETNANQRYLRPDANRKETRLWSASRLVGRRLGRLNNRQRRSHSSRDFAVNSTSIAEPDKFVEVENDNHNDDGPSIELMGGTLQSFFLHLEDKGEITSEQRQAILPHLLDVKYVKHRIEDIHAAVQAELSSYLNDQTMSGEMSADTAYYISSLLRLKDEGAATPRPAAPTAPAVYQENGNVVRLGNNINPDPPENDNQLYNGIWGYAAGMREYALQCNHNGLHIIDVTDAAQGAPNATDGAMSGYRVQFIPMDGGRVWRDVQTYQDEATNTTYAYVAAQNGGNLWVVDLSYLSGSDPHGIDSNPIPSSGYVDRGQQNYGHTLFLFGGLLFLNPANSDSCQVFDLTADPWNPPFLRNTTYGDCHDGTGKVGLHVPGLGIRDLLFSAGGYQSKHYVIDVTDIRNTNVGSPITLLGESPRVDNTYAHSSALSTDERFLYTFEEFNGPDIIVYDVSDVTNDIPQAATFRYSGDEQESSLTHNGHIRGNYLFVAYYEAGFRVFDISNPYNAAEVGKYETWRDPDGDGNFENIILGSDNGAWNLAFLPSGKVILSDISSGTFVFRVDQVALPHPPTYLNATLVEDGAVSLTWTAASTGGFPTGYSIYRSNSSSVGDGDYNAYFVIATNVVGTSHSDAALDPSTSPHGTYHHIVRATNAEGESGASNEAAVMIGNATPSASPSASPRPSSEPSSQPSNSLSPTLGSTKISATRDEGR